jgi:hypothetical protein
MTTDNRVTRVIRAIRNIMAYSVTNFIISNRVIRATKVIKASGLALYGLRVTSMRDYLSCVTSTKDYLGYVSSTKDYLSY